MLHFAVTMQLWRPHAVSYYLSDQPSYLVLIILVFVPGHSHALTGDLVSHYEPCSPKHPCPLRNHFTGFCKATMISNCDFFNYKVYLNKSSTFFVALNLRRNFTQVWSSSSFSTMKTPVLCVRQLTLCTSTFYCLWHSLSQNSDQQTSETWTGSVDHAMGRNCWWLVASNIPQGSKLAQRYLLSLSTTRLWWYLLSSDLWMTPNFFNGQFTRGKGYSSEEPG